MSEAFETWVKRWGVPQMAIDELAVVLGMVYEPQSLSATNWHLESSLQKQVKHAEAKRGNRMFRNNSGVAFRPGGAVRFGLGNESEEINKVSKSSDLIGLAPRIITAEDAGKKLAVFRSLEIKKPGWKYRGTPDEKAQLNWILLVNSLGGEAKFVSSLDDYE